MIRIKTFAETISLGLPEDLIKGLRNNLIYELFVDDKELEILRKGELVYLREKNEIWGKPISLTEVKPYEE